MSKPVARPRWWKKDDDGHDIYEEYDECVCLKCGRRWKMSDRDVPKCEVTHAHPTSYGLNCIKTLKQMFEKES